MFLELIFFIQVHLCGCWYFARYILSQRPANFCLRGFSKLVNTLGSVGRTVTVTATQLCHRSVHVPVANTSMNGYG